MKPNWISCSTYHSILEQAAKTNGRATLETSYGDSLEITIDPEFAKKEWAEIERWRNMRIVTEV